MDLNEVNLLGRVTRDTELKATPSGTHVATNSIATSENYMNSSGEKVENTQFTNIVFWGKVAEIADKYLTKGKRVFIKGKLQTRNWEDEKGNKKYATEVIVREMILLDGGSDKPKDEFKESDKKHGVKSVKPKNEFSVEDIPF
jgi:single-strand DNA-binding protein